MPQGDQEEPEKRAEALATHSIGLLKIGDAKGAHRSLQEAIHLGPENPTVKDAFSKLQIDDEEHQLMKLCKRLIFEQQEDGGNEAIRFLNGSEKIPDDVARTCMHIILRSGPVKHRNIQDDLLSGLLRQSTAAKAYLAERLKDKMTTVTFEEIYIIGDGAANGLSAVVLSPEAWSNEEARDVCEQDIFRLYLAKLLEAGEDDDSRAMRGISRLLATDAQKLQTLIDDDTFDAILSALDYRHDIATKSPATLAVAKFLEASEDRGQSMLTQYVTSHFARQSTENMVLAFSAAAAVFPIATRTAATMFLTPGFLPSLVPLLERKAHSRHAEMAALEMLSAACIDSACREGIRTHCIEWVQKAAKSYEGQKPAIAAVILSKVHGTPGQNDKETPDPEHSANTDALVHNLTQLLFKDPKANRNPAFEGLAHQSVRPPVKEKLINDKRWLQVFLQELRQAEPNSPAAFGGLAILDNLTSYLPVLSEEQKRIAQLKAYANAAPASSKSDPLNEEPAVTRRCSILVELGVVSTLVAMHKQLSSSCMALVFKIMLSLAKTPKLRGTIVQQGGVKLVAGNWSRIEEKSVQLMEVRRNAAHSLARLLISVDPAILFGPSGNALLQSTVISLITLLSNDDTLALDGPRDLLPTFEALLALTNLCSIPNNGASKFVIKNARASIEDLILSNNESIRRAATELLSNLVQHPEGTALFADGSPEATRRVHIFLALAGSEDLGTRKAAGGALATLTEFGEVVEAINKQSRGLELLLAMLDDESEEVIHRGLVSVLNILASENQAGRTATEQMRQMGVATKLQESVRKVKSQDILALVSQALQMLK